ncbi:hypothetical protein ACRE_046870 [Hapsidospora chrysogenum ATCC 11550]|uniref:Uncharacterized protein n=1 Tax=Hapsidospora chrysogenum (strain ATCC 11550 / CBS 779.69 / DSM 880 / IAM 14645 / JCM 23072 / IMI 49137) TaxID=857340 RepID=A0A086T588_HAPC1|nr:hypothetical protein ACRE_046870 [Hapsidospora chrysogenum ATCC 11550]
MAETPEAVRKLQNGLEPYIKPREQANYIRRILALHLASHSQDGPLSQPLALAAQRHDNVASATDAKGLHREYLDALRANTAARRQFEDVVQARPGRPELFTTDSSASNPLDERLAILKLQQKRQKLSAVRKYLDQLVDQPAAAPCFLDAEQIFKGAPPPPSVPKEVVNSLVAEKSAAAPDLRSQANQLEKVVLRTKLLLRQEEKLLGEAKARSRNRPDVVSNGAKLEALNATRTELISWIESELGNASAEEPNDETEARTVSEGNPEADQSTIEAGLLEIKQKYARYLESRRNLLSLVSARPRPCAVPDLKPNMPQTTPAVAPPPTNHLLIPYIERLLSLSRNQKALITQKSHLKSTLNKQAEHAYEGLGHLAEESQLLPAYPMKESLRRRSGLMEALTSKKSDVPDISSRIKPWVFASDSAKIANLESVAETLEGGQVALEGSIKALQELEALLGVGESETAKNAEEDEPGEDDVWLATGGAKDKGPRKHTDKPKAPERKPGDIWSSLHGNLGLIGQEDAA